LFVEKALPFTKEVTGGYIPLLRAWTLGISLAMNAFVCTSKQTTILFSFLKQKGYCGND
jgi:hypothetical protein